MVKLKDVAEKCNLSKTQVSRALNNSSEVSEETRKRVMQVAEELGYVKNIYASNLVQKTSNQIAVFIAGIEDERDSNSDDITNNNTYRILQGVNEFTSKHGYEPVIYIKNKYSNIDYISFCRQRFISGLIIFGCNYDDKDYLGLTKTDFPCVSIDIPNEGNNKGCVIVNNNYYAQSAVSHLIQNNCKKIALIAGSDRAQVTLERAMGYKIALFSHGMDYDPDIVANANFNLQLAKEKTLELFAKHNDIDGVFCMSDQMALGCLMALKQINKRVPEDVKVFGFDGNAVSKYVSPSISTVVQDFQKMGYAAAKLLIKIINGDATEKTAVIPCHMAYRESSSL